MCAVAFAVDGDILPAYAWTKNVSSKVHSTKALMKEKDMFNFIIRDCRSAVRSARYHHNFRRLLDLCERPGRTGTIEEALMIAILWRQKTWIV